MVLDLSDLEFLGVTGLNVLLEAQQLAAEGGTAILLVGSPAPAVERLLRLVGWTVTTDPVRRTHMSSTSRPIKADPVAVLDRADAAGTPKVTE